MIEYKCQQCNKIYHNKYDYNRHLNRKRPCKCDQFVNLEEQNNAPKNTKKH